MNPQVTSIDPVIDTFENVNGGTVSYPRTTTQAVWTNVIVHDGDTLVLGGTIQDQTNRGEEKVPYLGDIPLLGVFFRGKSKSTRQSSLLIFVTVDIIDPTGARNFETQSM
jgi:type II secretory pathway component HofQ